MDASEPALDEHLAAVESLLDELEVADRPTILVLNKIDRVESDREPRDAMASRPRVAVSAATGKGVESLLAAIEAALRPSPAVASRNPG